MGDDTVAAAKRKDRIRRKADKLAVKIVSLVVDKVQNDGTIDAYSGIEAAREIREMMVEAFSG